MGIAVHPSTHPALVWLRVRLTVGLGISDTAFAEFLEKTPNEAEYWERMSSDEGPHPLVIYFTAEGDEIPNCGARVHRWSPETWRWAGSNPGSVRHMVFHPRTLENDTVTAVKDEGASLAQRLDRKYVGVLLTSRLPSHLIPQPPPGPTFDPPKTETIDCADNTVTSWSVELGQALSCESRRKPKATLLGEVEFWAERYCILHNVQEKLNHPSCREPLERLSHADKLPSCRRWPTHLAQLSTSAAEAYRKACDLSMLCASANAIRNTLPRNVGLTPIRDALLPFHIALATISIAPREAFSLQDMERIHMKAAMEICEKIAEYVDFHSMFAATEEELNPVGNYLENGSSVRAQKPEPLACVTAGQERVRNALDLVLLWTRLHDRTLRSVQWSCGDRKHHIFPSETRRLFGVTNCVKSRCEDLLQILNDINEEMPDLKEDNFGYRRLRILLSIPLGVTFDIFNPGHNANWKLFKGRWEETVANKVDMPLSLEESPLAELPFVATSSLDDILPITSLLDVFTTSSALPESLQKRLGGKNSSNPEDVILQLQQEREVLGAKLAEAQRVMTEDRQTIVALKRELEKAWSLNEQLMENARRAPEKEVPLYQRPSAPAVKSPWDAEN